VTGSEALAIGASRPVLRPRNDFLPPYRDDRAMEYSLFEQERDKIAQRPRILQEERMPAVIDAELSSADP